MTEQILVEFISDTSQIDGSVDALAKLGTIDAAAAAAFKKTNAEINAQAAALRTVAAQTAPITKGLDSVSKAAKNVTASFMQGFQEGVMETLQEAGVSAQEFADALSKSGAIGAESTQTIKQELRGLVEQLARAKASGQDYGEEYDRLKQRAGELKDAIGDVNKEVSATGSDTRVFDGLISGAQGVAGAFSIAQGATALFGAKEEEVQKVLLKVNAAMAILQGLQGIQSVLLKDSALNQLLENRALILKNAQLAIAEATESRYIIVRVAATVAQKALNLAMAANPIGIVVVALAGLIAAVNAYANSARSAAADAAQLNAVLASTGEALDRQIDAYNTATDVNIANLKKVGALDSQIQKTSLDNERDVIRLKIAARQQLVEQAAKATDIEADSYKQLTEKIKSLDADIEKANAAGRVKSVELEKQIQEEQLAAQLAGINTQILAAAEGSKRQLDLRKKAIALEAAIAANAGGLTEAQKLEKLKKAQEDQYQLEVEFQKRLADIQISNIQTQLINAKEGSDQEFSLRKKLLNAQRQSELASTKLSESEKQAIREKSFQDQLKLQKDYELRVIQQESANEISRNNAEMSSVKTSLEDRLLLQQANIDLEAGVEIAAADGNSAKLKEIYAKREADKRAIQIQFENDALEREIRNAELSAGAITRALQRTAGNDKASYSARIAAEQQLTTITVSEINKRIDLLGNQRAKGEISEQEYTDRYLQYSDQRLQAEEENTKRIAQLRKDQNAKIVESIIAGAQAISGVLSSLADLQDERDKQKIQGMQSALDAQKEAGAITEKDAIASQKRIDAETKKVQIAAAKRQKEIAIFNAIITTAQAVLQALASSPPPFSFILAGIAAAAGAAQVAIIASRPLPKFGKGKTKDNAFQGWAQIGETGPEILERNGKQYLTQGPTFTFLKSSDIVWNPKQTQEKLDIPLPKVNADMLTRVSADSGMNRHMRDLNNGMSQMNKTLSKMPITNLSLDREGFNMSVQEGLSRIKYNAKRYSTKR